MEKCVFFGKNIFKFENHELRGDRGRGPISIEELYFCKHKHSPVSLVGLGGNVLKCNGELSNCPIDPQKLIDGLR